MSDALKEDKFDRHFSEGMPDRVEEMNNAQLQGIKEHLESTVRRSNFHSWRNANRKVLAAVDEVLNERLWKIEREVRADEMADTKIHAREEKIFAKQRKKNDIKNATKENARNAAEKEVMEFEIKRQKEEKVQIMKQQPLAEEQRLQWTYLGIVILAVGFTLSYLATNVILFQALGMLFFIGIAGYVFRIAYFAGIIEPKVVTEEDLENAISIREEELFLKAMYTEKQRQEQNKNAEAQAKVYRKKRKEEEAAKKALDDQINQMDLDNFMNNLHLLGDDDSMDIHDDTHWQEIPADSLLQNEINAANAENNIDANNNESLPVSDATNNQNNQQNQDNDIENPSPSSNVINLELEHKDDDSSIAESREGPATTKETKEATTEGKTNDEKV